MGFGEYLGAGTGRTKGLYHLEGNSNDSSGNAYNGTDTGGVTYGKAYGKYNQGALYDGVDDRTNLGAHLTAANGTVAFWMRPVAITNTKRPLSDTGGYIYTEFNASNQMRVTVFDTGTKSTGYVGLATTSRDHWVITWNSTTVILYKNGVSAASVAAGALGSVAGNLQIGGVAGVYSNVEIDEVILENVAWSAVDVQKFYTFSVGRFGVY